IHGLALSEEAIQSPNHEHTLNTRGRKSLGYRSPNKVFLTHLLAA
ncbi:hypothetical protein ACZ87_03200, partial [Candidatus Erwinia dacicola]